MEELRIVHIPRDGFLEKGDLEIEGEVLESYTTLVLTSPSHFIVLPTEWLRRVFRHREGNLSSTYTLRMTTLPNINTAPLYEE